MGKINKLSKRFIYFYNSLIVQAISHRFSVGDVGFGSLRPLGHLHEIARVADRNYLNCGVQVCPQRSVMLPVCNQIQFHTFHSVFYNLLIQFLLFFLFISDSLKRKIWKSGKAQTRPYKSRHYPVMGFFEKSFSILQTQS